MQSQVAIELNDLYREIHSCHICPSMDPLKALRRTEAVDSSMDVFIVSQALAEGQLRKSGVNFFTEAGKPGYTGQHLERFLELFNRTIYPQRQIRLSSGAIVRKASSPRLSVYNSEITQCYPGRQNGKKGDRPPRLQEIISCVGQNFLKREIALIKPKLLLLMGDESRRAFYKYFDGTSLTDTIDQHLNRIVESGSVPAFGIEQIMVSVMPIYHPAARGGLFKKMRTSEPLIRLIKACLQSHESKLL